MSKASRKFHVPDELANLYDFANTLDLRHFAHHGVEHAQGDALETPQDLASWMAARGLAHAGAKLTPAMFETALGLRTALRDYLQHDPAGRAQRGVIRALNEGMAAFPLVAELDGKGKARLRPRREDALAGLSTLVAELYDGARNGSLDRLKMCAADECRRVFFDRSKPATRRWCMSSLCGNRIKTRAYRARQRASQ